MKARKYYLAVIYIIIFALTMSISLTLCEVIARAFHLSRTYNSYPSFVNRKSALDYFPQKNSLGWRDREFTRDKKINTFRIACIGDSVTEGYAIALENTFPKLLEKILQSAGYKAEVMNLGKSGNDTSDDLLAVKAAMEFNPDLIIFQFGMNDIETFEHREFAAAKNEMPADNMAAEKNGAHPSLSPGFLGRNTEPAYGGRMYKKFNPRALLRKSVLYLALAERYNYFKLRSGVKNWAFDEWDIKEDAWEKEFLILKEGLARIEDKAKILVCYLPYDFQVYSIREEVLIPSDKIGKFCRDNNYKFVDFTRIFKNQKDVYGLFIDDAHLSAHGNKVVAEYLRDFILDEITK